MREGGGAMPAAVGAREERGLRGGEQQQIVCVDPGCAVALRRLHSATEPLGSVLFVFYVFKQNTSGTPFSFSKLASDEYDIECVSYRVA